MLTMIDGSIELTSKPMRPDQDQVEWCAAAKTVELKTSEYHGDARADALRMHHRNVIALALDYNWSMALFYDQRTRELMAEDPRHDPRPKNYNLILMAYARCQRAPDSVPIPSPPSSHQPNPKRFSPYDNSSRASRISKPNVKCFRCEAPGHISASCDSKFTSAGLPCAYWNPKVGPRGSLSDSAGLSFCFRWTYRSSCHTPNCGKIHRCSVCGDSQHGANNCSK